MGKPSVGIIVNSASGRDIRRLVSYATVISNNEKMSIVKRLVLSMQSMDVHQILFMPDAFFIGSRVIADLTGSNVLSCSCEVLDSLRTDSMKDTVDAAHIMEQSGVSCVVVLGGDGTSRAASMGLTNTPLLPVSTGTNNVYPDFVEGTVAGMAAAAICRLDYPYECCLHDKRIEVYVNGEMKSIALVDAVVSNDRFAGSKAIWKTENIRQIVVTRCHPASIGFSAAAGCRRVILPEEDLGLAVAAQGGTRVRTAVASGLLDEMELGEPVEIRLEEPFRYETREDGIIALDGEREVPFRAGNTIDFVIRRNGPWRVLIDKVLEKAVDLDMFLAEDRPGLKKG
jgi:Uncharacterized conserved protein